MGRRTISASVLSLLVLLAVAPAWAQTADGVGDGETPRRELNAEDAAQDILALADYERKFYQLSLRSWAIGTPGFVLNAFFDANTNHWHDGVHNFAYGAEFTTRIPDKYDLVVSADWANLRTPDGYWLEDGDPIADANWTESTLSLLTVDVSFHWLTNLDRQERLQLYYGIGLGASLVLGEFRKYELLIADCGQEFNDARDGGNTELLNNCFDANGDPTVTSDYQLENIPPVLPSVSATMGFRYLIADQISIALEGGLKLPFFYGGLEIGYFWEVQPR